MTVTDILEEFKLSPEKHNEIFEQIKNFFLYGKYPVESPTAIVDLGPPGSGKTGLNSYSRIQFPNDNVIIVNGDEIRTMFPNSAIIAQQHPDLYAQITDQSSRIWTRDLFEMLLKKKYNIIFEGTGRNTSILDTIKNQMAGYNVVVRGMAVSELNCLMSILFRYRQQLESLGYGRLTPLSAFLNTFENMPQTIDAIEKSGISVEIFQRGDEPILPQQIYSNNLPSKFPSAKQAVLEARQLDTANALQTFSYNQEKIQQIISKSTEEELKIIDRIFEIYRSNNNSINKEDIYK